MVSQYVNRLSIKFGFALISTLLFLYNQSANAQISNLPPLLKAPVAPNIVFTLDDSGSMQWEAVPDAIINASGAYNGFPIPVGTYFQNRRDYPQTLGFGHTLNIARYRSSTVNALYYDPETTYTPWVDSNNISMGNANPLAARYNAIYPTGVTTLPTIDLTSTDQKAATGCIQWVDADAGISPPSSSGCSGSTRRRDFYPATYYRYNGGSNCNTNTLTCFTRVEIRSGTTYPKATSRDDCKLQAGVCTYAEEIQNFANWFQYWRSRVSVARGGVGQAFATQGTGIRVGYGAINEPNTVASGVRADFAGTNRTSFFNYLYTHPMPPNGTPLRLAVDQVGQYFTRTDVNGPWQNIPGTGSTATDQATCRQNYHILMTDGYWNGSAAPSPRNGNIDNTVGPTINGPNNTSFRYQPARPYSDVTGSTLADIAMYYWNHDLRPDWSASRKNVPVNAADPAFWPHLVHFTVGLGVQATLNPDTDLPALTSGALSWSVPAADSPNNVDDLWHAAVNSRGQFFSASNPADFARALTDSLQTISNRVGASAAVGSSSNVIRAGGSLYTSSYKTDDWSGEITQINLDANGSPLIPATGWKGTVPAPDNRNIFTYVDNIQKGQAFLYSNLEAADQAYFDIAAATYTNVTGQNLVDYIRGKSFSGLRTRSSTTPFGDFVNSAPQYIQAGEDEGYSFLPAASGGSTYAAYLVAKAGTPAIGNTPAVPGRTPIVYAGSNDGMLHALNATTGQEAFAYIPKAVMSNLPNLASPMYTHRFFVDATPNIGDAWLNGSWKTVLVGTTGAGARAIFALDVSNPSSFNRNDVLWELNSANDTDIGYTIGTPQIGRTPQGEWVTVFGNGYNSTSNRAILFVVRLSDGMILSKLDTGVGSSSSPNGLATPRLMIGSDGTIQAAYAGDLQGNLWKFDFTTPTRQIAFSGNPLFTAAIGNTRQPITSQPEIVEHVNGGYMIIFGTGKIFEDNDSTNIDVQSLYGVWDQTGIANITPTRISNGQSALQQQSLTLVNSTPVFYQLTNNIVDWNTRRGWYINLNVAQGERVVINPQILIDQTVFTTVIPNGSSDSCASFGSSTTFSIRSLTGGTLPYRTIDANQDSTIDQTDTFYSAIRGNLTFGSTILKKGKKTIIFQSNATDPTNLGGANGDGSVSETSGAYTLRLWRQILGKD